jgi:hypothetical protein
MNSTILRYKFCFHLTDENGAISCHHNDVLHYFMKMTLNEMKIILGEFNPFSDYVSYEELQKPFQLKECLLWNPHSFELLSYLFEYHPQLKSNWTLPKINLNEIRPETLELIGMK